MSNPTLTVANIPELSRIGHEKGTTVVVDNTFAPMVLYPARLDANVVLHSISKFISGGVDVITGPLLSLYRRSFSFGERQGVEELMCRQFLVRRSGPTPYPTHNQSLHKNPSPPNRLSHF
ncbi:hypothetical protein V6N13_080351 [Hibiscus sabdariffa]|uniref:Uncharacterized protein n=1 Tax=Hibiscus sabdariffa TaxID=183260 RepID=A0ABR2PY68_9ROSI